MSSVAVPSYGVDLLRLCRPGVSALRAQKASASSPVIMNLNSGGVRKSDDVSLRVSRAPPAPERSDMKLGDFDQFVVREAERDEELWEAAWLRAESQWEDRVNDRYAQSYKRKFAEQEFNALRKQCKGHHGLTFKCIVAVNQEGDMKQTAIETVHGTLDLSIRNLLQGETFPGERVKAPLFSNNTDAKNNKYAYVCNVCVAVTARRQGIASNMMQLAIALTRISGLTEVYVHVHRKNLAAQGMYQKLGFEMVETAVSQLSGERIHLLCLKM